MGDEKIEKAVQRDWNFNTIVKDLRAQKWRGTEPHRIDRMLWLMDAYELDKKAKAAIGRKEWDSAAKDGVEGEIAEEYAEALAEQISRTMQEHVYVTIQGSEVYAGQYEDMAAEDLRAMGFEIEGRELSGTKDDPDRPYNLIGHAYYWDGTLRSYKAVEALKRFHPKTACDVARIWMEQQADWKMIYDVQFPMFLENKDLVEFVKTNTSSEDNWEKFQNYYITHWDLTDSVADMWKLSPELQAAYPTVDQYFNGVNMGQGWHELLRKVRFILDQV